MHRTRSFRLVLICLVFGLLATAAAGQEVFDIAGAMAPPLELNAAAPPLLLAKSAALEPVATMARAEIAVPAEVEAITLWNAAGQQPLKTGITRRLAVPHKVAVGEEQMSTGLGTTARDALRTTPSGVVWAARVEAQGAWGLRARLSDVSLPRGTELWVYGEQGDAVAFGAELIRPDGDLWTPAVGGEVLSLEIRVPHAALAAGESLHFELDQLAQIFRLDAGGVPILDDGIPAKFCTESAACWTNPNPSFDILKNATSYMETVRSNGVFLCSGTLMNDTVSGSFIPYLLTANHCLDNQNDATSTSFYFDYIPSSCGGADPPFFTLARVNGATLLATRPASDSSFLRLSSQPSGLRGYAGWTTAVPPTGEMLRSFSHPNGRSMRYSRTVALNTGGCGLSQTEYLFSDQTLGGVQGGSSGSHIVNENFRVVGQLRGACGIDPSDGCFWSLNNRFDGRFGGFYPSIQQWLNPSTGGGSCVANDTTLCLNNDRFEVTSTFVRSDGTTGVSQAFELTNDTGYFWFFNSSNVEVVIKVLSGCAGNNHYWVFAGGLTDVGVRLTVRDTQTGNVWTGNNALGQAFRTITDTGALPCS